MPDASIYQQLLGPEFMRLGPVLQHVHGAAPRVNAHGRVAVRHGKGILVRLLNWINRVPPSNPAAELHLKIERTPDKEKWIRKFGSKPLITQQWAENGYFVEAVGPVRMTMRIYVQDGKLVFEPVHTKVLGIKVPKALGVSVFAEVLEEGNGWHVLVQTKSNVLGLLFEYKGKIELEP